MVHVAALKARAVPASMKKPRASPKTLGSISGTSGRAVGVTFIVGPVQEQRAGTAVAVLGQWRGQRSSCAASIQPWRKAISSGQAIFPGPGAFQRGDELAGLQQAVVRAGVEPGVAAPMISTLSWPGAGSVALTSVISSSPRRVGLDAGGDVADLLVVEVQAGDGVVALGALGFSSMDGRGRRRTRPRRSARGRSRGRRRRWHPACSSRAEQDLEVVAVEDVVARTRALGCAATNSRPRMKAACARPSGWAAPQ